MAATLVQQGTKSKNGKISKYSFLFTDANPAAGISASQILSDVSGLLLSIRVKFGSVTVPDSIVASITDVDGIEVASGTLSASGALTLAATNQPIANGFLVTISGNTTALGTAELFFYMIKI